MFNPFGMAIGFLVAQTRGASDPLFPALVGGILPMPAGPIAAVVLADRAPAPAPARIDPKQVDETITRATNQLAKVGQPGINAALAAAAAASVAISQVPEDGRAALRKDLAGLVDAIEKQIHSVDAGLPAARVEKK